MPPTIVQPWWPILEGRPHPTSVWGQINHWLPLVKTLWRGALWGNSQSDHESQTKSLTSPFAKGIAPTGASGMALYRKRFLFAITIY